MNSLSLIAILLYSIGTLIAGLKHYRAANSGLLEPTLNIACTALLLPLSSMVLQSANGSTHTGAQFLGFGSLAAGSVLSALALLKRWHVSRASKVR